MAKINLKNKQTVLTKAQIHKTDTGSPEAQIALLTQSIAHLTKHLKTNPKDYSSRRGLLKKVGKRKALLNYLKSVSLSRYKKVISANNLKG